MAAEGPPSDRSVRALSTRDQKSELPFDGIEVMHAGRTGRVDLDGFLSIGLPERVRLLLEKRVRFVRGPVEVETKVALEAIYRAGR